MLHITIKGDGPHVPELIERRDDPAVVCHVYEPPEGSDPCAPETWEYGNPGLAAGIKSRSYMVDRARHVAGVPADLALFGGEDCNLAGSITREMICSVADWNGLLGGDPAPRAGDCVVGIDLGGSDSLSAAAVCWPSTGRLEVFAACAVSDDRTLADRGRDDAVGDRYEQLAATGELWTYAARRTTPVALFIAELAAELRGQRVVSAGADRYRRAEAQDAMADADCRWPMVWRGQGASATADGSADVRSFERSVRGAWLRPARGARLMLSAISESVIVRDKLGNPCIERARRRGRIDPLSAAVIATGLAERIRARPATRYRSFVIGDAAFCIR